MVLSDPFLLLVKACAFNSDVYVGGMCGVVVGVLWLWGLCKYVGCG